MVARLEVVGRRVGVTALALRLTTHCGRGTGTDALGDWGALPSQSPSITQ